MEYRTANIIETLKRLPAPEYAGQVYQTPVITETWEHGFVCDRGAAPRNDLVKLLTVKAVEYGRNRDRWLEWVMDV